MNNQVQSITEFYNSIAPEYNGHMTNSDKKVRESVRDLFSQHVAGGNVMDFGGGTGLDLPWLLKNNSRVVFVEPSARMRSLAHVNNVSKEEITFIESNTDFNSWNETDLPFQQKVNGIIANFAVLNCIENIDTLFEKFALVASGDCRVVATVIDPHFGSMNRNYSFLSAVRMLLRSKLTIYNEYKNQFHATYIHSLKSIERASSRYFQLQSINSLDFSTFTVLIFRKR